MLSRAGRLRRYLTPRYRSGKKKCDTNGQPLVKWNYSDLFPKVISYDVIKLYSHYVTCASLMSKGIVGEVEASVKMLKICLNI